MIPKNNERTIIAQGVGRQCKDAVRHTTFLKELDPLLELAEGQELFLVMAEASLMGYCQGVLFCFPI